MTKKTTSQRSEKPEAAQAANAPEGDALYRAHQVHTLAQLLFHQLSGTWNGAAPRPSQGPAQFRQAETTSAWNPGNPETAWTAYPGAFPWYR